MSPLFKYEIGISLFTLKLTHKDCHSVLKFIYLFIRERERERKKNKCKIFRVLCSVKWLELAPFEHDFSCSSFSCLFVCPQNASERTRKQL